MKLAKSLLVAASLAVMPAMAQYTGPTTSSRAGPVSYASVAEILKNPVDDVPVSLQGKLLRQVGKEKYIFSDGTGEIRVEIDARLFAGVKVDENTTVRIRGEVEKDFLQSPEIDVDLLSVVN